jgi:hypothetical protein
MSSALVIFYACLAAVEVAVVISVVATRRHHCLTRLAGASAFRKFTCMARWSAVGPTVAAHLE